MLSSSGTYPPGIPTGSHMSVCDPFILPHFTILLWQLEFGLWLIVHEYVAGWNKNITGQNVKLHFILSIFLLNSDVFS